MKSVDSTTEQYTENDNNIKDYVSKSGAQWTSSSTGLYYRTLVAKPTAKQATIGEEVEFTYKATNMLTGALVDSTIKGYPVYYPLGVNSILAGLEEGVSLMREGETTALLIPSYLGYGSEAKTNLPAYSVVRFDITLNRSRTQDEQINEYIAAQKFTNVESTGTGLRFIKTKEVAGASSPGIGQTLTVKYKGKMLRSATAFDSTGTGTFDAVLGRNSYVKGFEEGLSKLKIGEAATIIFPSSLGYGTDGRVSNNRYVITPYAPLRFDIEVVSAK
ncbi:FKBP-type peptidyl-prolyl cis-trans isomerase [Spirosoma pomorum]